MEKSTKLIFGALLLVALSVGIAAASTPESLTLQSTVPSVFSVTMDTSTISMPLVLGSNSVTGSQFTVSSNTAAGWALTVADNDALTGLLPVASQGHLKYVHSADNSLTGSYLTNPMVLSVSSQTPVSLSCSQQTLYSSTVVGDDTQSVKYSQVMTSADPATGTGVRAQMNFAYVFAANA